MLILLASLLLSGTPTARAEDAPASANSPDIRDTDGDGVVSGKERRVARRAARRAANRRSGGKEMTDEEADAADAAESAARSGAASTRAAGAASALKSSLTPADAGGGLPPGSPGNAAGGTGGPATTSHVSAPSSGKENAFTAGASGDPGRPKAPSDFALAARSGYAPAFAAAGLKIGPDGRGVVRLDGKPAGPEDYARLQSQIASMPAALGRRPDFFSIVSPEHYADLKRGYKEKKEGDAVYKDVGTTEGDRDFVHTASCDKLSGDCNKSVEKASYKKGDFVAPEDLDSMWGALQKELDSSSTDQGREGGLPDPGAARSDLARQKAIEMAKGIYDDSRPEKNGTAAAASKTEAETVVTPVSRAVASVRRLWKSAATLALPGKADAADSGSGALLLAAGAAAFAALGVGIFFLRRKG